MTKLALLILMGCIALLQGCASSHVIPVAKLQETVACTNEVPKRDVLVGVALSGGGSRAALFGASGLEALAGVKTSQGKSLLEHVGHVSSVSGGSLAATSYVLSKPPASVPMLDAQGTLTPEYRTFFEQYRGKLSQDFQSSLVTRQLMSLRWVNSALAARTLSEILKDDLLGTATFQEAGARERAADAPGLIVNTTLYNNGRRLVMSTLPQDAFNYNFVADLERSVISSGRPMRNADTIARRWQTLKPLTPPDIRMDPCPIALVGAAAASASFPPLVGPITMRVSDEEVFWHVGDGGLYENSGLETLLFLHLKQLRDKAARKSLIIAFDSSYPFSVGERQLSRRSLPFTLLTFDFSRVPSIMEERASAYQQLFFQSLQLEGVFPGPETVMVVLLRHTDAKWNEDLSDLPNACEGERAQLANTEAVRERIAEIPTLLRVPSACDRELLAAAAQKLVAEHQAGMVEFLSRR
ncbi:patatin-like phospholipase family protein [Variovorax sp. J22R24]|uniref:patatin-like phospholipase family protein n=1 Tax=Variovorax gracilis TaxID=3053502 RepID=UPI002574BC1B|nr:patatin-like phospholipase family protein [Variovorax sp. J22R24]MDM0109649.1 patatin-like phospholipase family protein [Variovorax sp. J22R24]